MVYIPSINLTKELLSTLDMCRLEYGHAGDVNLIIKCSSLQAKQIANGVSVGFWRNVINRDNLAYAALIWDETERPACVWAVATTEEEMAMVDAIFRKDIINIHLFNEACVNVAFNRGVISHQMCPLNAICEPYSGHQYQANEQVNQLLNRMASQKTSIGEDFSLFNMEGAWREMRASLIHNSPDHANINLLQGNEGDQQEELAKFLLDHLSPLGVFKGAEFAWQRGRKEFADIFFQSDKCAFAVQSKCLQVFERINGTPTRDKLAANSKKALSKAINQCRGTAAKFASCETIYERGGGAITIAQRNKIHLICLVPDLSLLTNCPEFGQLGIHNFQSGHKYKISILDPSQLFRCSQGGEIIEKTSENISRVDAFEKILEVRNNASLQIASADFDFRIAQNQDGEILFEARQ